MNDSHSQEQPHKNWFDRIRGALSGEHDFLTSKTELLQFLKQSAHKFDLDADGLTIIESAFDLAKRQVREIMLQRAQVKMIQVDQKPEEFLPLIHESGHSRYPVINEDFDDVVGILLVKDLLPLIMQSPEQRAEFDLRTLIRSATFIPESKRLNSLLKEFRDTHSHMAIVVDEYGGTAGIVTIEDILEQIVGDIEDEHDVNEEDEINLQNDGSYVLKATLSIEDFNEAFKTHFFSDSFDTIGGLVTQYIGHLPQRQEVLELEGWRFTIVSADSRRIKWLKAERLSALTKENN